MKILLMARLIRYSVAIGFGFAVYSNVAAQGKSSPSFSPIKGQGLPVCQAYLRRLSEDSAADAPYCGRPETTEVEGFQELNRVPLTIDEAYRLSNRIYNFTYQGDQETLANGRTAISRREIERDLHKQIFAWRYDPPVDIDNDGSPDDVVVWQGRGAARASFPCGFIKQDSPWWQTQLAYVLDGGGLERVNQERTRTIFGAASASEEKRSKGFQPVGRTIGIFNYKKRFYFDTFLDSSTRRRGENVLGVFLHENGVSRGVCEYRWNH